MIEHTDPNGGALPYLKVVGNFIFLLFGIIFATLRLSGNIPVLNSWFTIKVNCLIGVIFICLINLVEILLLYADF